MKEFAQLIAELDQESKPARKAELLAGYFKAVNPEEKTAAIALLRGQAPRPGLNNRQLKEWALDLSGIPEWLFEDAYGVVGDLTETIALLLPPERRDVAGDKSLVQWKEEIGTLKFLDEKEQRTWVLNSWKKLGPQERFVLNKLVTGIFRAAVSPDVLVSALSRVSGLVPSVITWRLSQAGEMIDYKDLTGKKTCSDEYSLPYPATACTELEEGCHSSGLEKKLGPASGWLAEWKWEGLPVQLIARRGEIHIWTELHELVTREFPELHEFMAHLPEGTVLEGELLAFRQGLPVPSSGLQKRIGRKSISKKLLETHTTFLACDCLEYKGEDIRRSDAGERRLLLEDLHDKIPATEHFQLSPLIPFSSWEELAAKRKKAREYRAQGILLKKAAISAGDGSGDRWKWKAEPFRIPGVLLYARKDAETGLYTNFSLAAWERGQLISFVNVNSNLSESDAAEVTAFVKENSLEKFGPVRTVKPRLVFEIAFDGIQPSSRRKSGVAVTSPRITRWMKDKSPEEAGSLEDLQALCGNQ